MPKNLIDDGSGGLVHKCIICELREECLRRVDAGEPFKCTVRVKTTKLVFGPYRIPDRRERRWI